VSIEIGMCLYQDTILLTLLRSLRTLTCTIDRSRGSNLPLPGMADTKQVREAGKLLGADLRAIREARHIGKDKILEATRLPRDVVDEFDRSCLVDHPAFNRVYLLSIAGSYARVLGLSREEVQDAVSETLSGVYDGALGRRYLDQMEDEEKDSEEPEPVVESEATGSVGDPEEPEPVTESEESEPVGDNDEPGAGTDSELPERPRQRVEFVQREGRGTADEPVGNSFKSRLSEIQRGLLLPNLRGFIPAVSVILVIALFLWYLIFGSSGPTEEQSVLKTPIPDSTVQLQPVPHFFLADTLVFDIIASQERLDPIRVTIDSDMRRPYWIEYLDTLRVAAMDSALFEREAAVASIRLFDYEIPDSMLDSRGRLNITRNRAQYWLDKELALQSRQ